MSETLTNGVTMTDEWDRQIEADVKAGRLDKLGKQALGDYRARNTVSMDSPIFSELTISPELVPLELSESSVVEIKNVKVGVTCLHCGNEHDYTIERNDIDLCRNTIQGLDGKSASSHRYFSYHAVCPSCGRLFTIKLS